MRYIHLRECISALSNEIKSVGVVGAGHGLSEVAIATEFPDIQFTLTDINDQNYPNYHKAMDICWKWGIDNVRFGVWNILEPTRRTFDLICSTEVLEHIEDYRAAAQAMLSAANRYVYCLVPFSDKATNADPARRKRALERHGHYVYGFDEEDLRALFPRPEYVRGAYFSDAGQKLRAQLKSLDGTQIDENLEQLKRLAYRDLQDRIPSIPAEGQGIKVLSKAD